MINSKEVSGSISYQAHVSDIGWQSWKNENQIAGTTGEAKQIEALKIKLTGAMAQK